MERRTRFQLKDLYGFDGFFSKTRGFWSQVYGILGSEMPLGFCNVLRRHNAFPALLTNSGAV